LFLNKCRPNRWIPPCFDELQKCCLK